uniref:Fatty acid desaturase domain-containing protein n=1 Tax=Romanomermis culicivorax TaxID=13658 RepID=A0A915IQV6_ROMCU
MATSECTRRDSNGDVTLFGETDLYHAKRRKAIITDHPELRSLQKKPDPSFKYVLIACMISHLVFAYHVRDWPAPLVILAGLTVGILFSCPISNSLHEIVHNLAFENNPAANRIFGLFVNLPLVWPLFGAYDKSHRYHHTYLGTELDIKYPDAREAMEYDTSFFKRLYFILMHPIHSSHRFQIKSGNNVTPLILWNLISITIFDGIIFTCFGYKSFLYLLIAFWLNECILIEGSKTFLDHWSDEKTSHTNSYYGPVNMINFNIGHHREHHDFPNIAGRYLSLVTEAAPEYYKESEFIEKHYFGPIWQLLTAKPYEGLMRYANKIHVKRMSIDENGNLLRFL